MTSRLRGWRNTAGALALATFALFTTSPAWAQGGSVAGTVSGTDGDAAAVWTALDNEWAVTLFVQNLGNEIGLVEFLPISGLGSNPSLGYPTNPREFGLQLRWTPFK